jgi:hypothetical protein
MECSFAGGAKGNGLNKTQVAQDERQRKMARGHTFLPGQGARDSILISSQPFQRSFFLKSWRFFWEARTLGPCFPHKKSSTL